MGELKTSKFLKKSNRTFSYSVHQSSISQGSTDMIIGIGIGRYIGIGRFIGKADMGNAYRYRLSVSADKKAHIGSLTDIL